MLLEEFIKLNYKPRKPLQAKAENVKARKCVASPKRTCDVYCLKSGWPEVLPTEILDKKNPFPLEESFSDLLIFYMNKKGMESPQVYKASGLTKANFSNQLKRDHWPKKETVLALCVGLKLNMEEATHFMKRAGFAFSNANLRDVIVKYYILNGIYDIDEVNESLYEHDTKTLN